MYDKLLVKEYYCDWRAYTYTGEITDTETKCICVIISNVSLEQPWHKLKLSGSPIHLLSTVYVTKISKLQWVEELVGLINIFWNEATRKYFEHI